MVLLIFSFVNKEEKNLIIPESTQKVLQTEKIETNDVEEKTDEVVGKDTTKKTVSVSTTNKSTTTHKKQNKIENKTTTSKNTTKSTTTRITNVIKGERTTNEQTTTNQTTSTMTTTKQLTTTQSCSKVFVMSWFRADFKTEAECVAMGEKYRNPYGYKCYYNYDNCGEKYYMLRLWIDENDWIYYKDVDIPN